MIERLALLHCDGSITVLPIGTTMTQAQRERAVADLNGTDPETSCIIVTVRLEVTRHVEEAIT